MLKYLPRHGCLLCISFRERTRLWWTVCSSGRCGGLVGWWVHPPLPFSPRKSPPVHEYSSDPALHFNLASCSGGIKNVSWRLVLFWLESRRLAGRAVGRLVMLSCHRGLTVVSPWSATLPPHQYPVQSRLLWPNLRLQQVVATVPPHRAGRVMSPPILYRNLTTVANWR